jgi:hypothetical protein
VYQIKSARSSNLTEITSTKQQEKFECFLVNTDSYSESIEIKTINPQKNAAELIIKTQLHSARNPSEWRIKSRTCIEIDCLRQLQKTISDYLKNQDSSSDEPILL